MRLAVAIIAVVIVVAIVVYFVVGRSSEQAASHEEPDRLGSDRLYGDNQAPAGPGAEDEQVRKPGQSSPGPWIP